MLVAGLLEQLGDGERRVDVGRHGAHEERELVLAAQVGTRRQVANLHAQSTHLLFTHGSPLDTRAHLRHMRGGQQAGHRDAHFAHRAAHDAHHFSLRAHRVRVAAAAAARVHEARVREGERVLDALEVVVAVVEYDGAERHVVRREQLRVVHVIERVQHRLERLQPVLGHAAAARSAASATVSSATRVARRGQPDRDAHAEQKVRVLQQELGGRLVPMSRRRPQVQSFRLLRAFIDRRRGLRARVGL